MEIQNETEQRKDERRRSGKTLGVHKFRGLLGV